MTKKTTRKVEKHRKDKNGTTQKSIPTHKKGFDTYFRLALLAAVGVLLFYPPYFRGLFFATEMLTTHVATTAVFLLWSILVLRKKDVSLNIGLLDWLVLCYAVIYCLSIIGAVDTRQAMSGALKALNYGLIYFLVAKITLDLRMFKNWLVVLYVSSVGVALVGIGPGPVEHVLTPGVAALVKRHAGECATLGVFEQQVAGRPAAGGGDAASAFQGRQKFVAQKGVVHSDQSVPVGRGNFCEGM